MDRPEILANKGYKSIADALREEGEKRMQPLLDAANARADRAEALLRKHGLLV
mgnify:FL=1